MTPYLPKFSIGSKVTTTTGGETGVIHGISTQITYRENDGQLLQEDKTYYMVKMPNGSVKRVDEKYLRDADQDNDDSNIDEFIADLLLLSRKLDPERVDNTLNELLKKGENDE